LIRFIEQPDSTGASAGAARGLVAFPMNLVQRLRRSPLFVVMVLIPTLLAVIYYGLIAAPIYVSETHFIVRTPSQQQPSTLDSVLLGVGFGSASASTTDSYAVHEYISSRDAVHDLEQYHNLRAKLARPPLDPIARFPRPFARRTFEDLYHSYGRFVNVSYNSQTGISVLTVKAFNPQDAAELATALLDGGEGVINRLNDRSAADAVNDAKRHTQEAEKRVTSAETALTEFRNREKLIDPTRSSLSELELAAKIEGQLMTLRAERSALAASAPSSPQLPVMDQQIQAFQTQSDEERGKIAGQDSSLAPMIGEYEQLVIDRDFAAKELTAASTSAETAQMDMRRKHLYLERIVPPNVPDAAREPRRFYSVILVFLTSLLCFGSVVLVRAGFREHGQ
jgi:capsular polysaccharide transport system permease protein